MISKIPFEQILSYARRSVVKDELKDLTLTPSSIYHHIGQNSQWIAIPNWSSFEQGDVDFDVSQLTHLFAVLDFDYACCDLIVVTDQEWADKQGFLIQGNDLATFINWYEEYRQMDFWQPLDYVFFNRSTGEWVLIHHEGMATKLIRSHL